MPFLRWQEVVGPKIARQAQPEFLKDGVLQVRVENSVWLGHLRFLAEELRQQLNKNLPCPEIKAIRFRQGPLDSLPPMPASTCSRSNRSVQVAEQPPSPLSAEQQELLETIADRDLRQVLENLLRRQQKHSHT